MNYLKNMVDKTGDFHKLELRVKQWRAEGKKIVFTNGCFDLLHRGHITYLAEASSKGDVLIIGLNSDNSVKKLKGPKRPVLSEDDRVFHLTAFSFVDFVILFDEETPEKMIEFIAPDVLVKGGDYDSEITDSTHPHYIVGSNWMKKNNKEVCVIQFVKGYSTSDLIKKIQNL